MLILVSLISVFNIFDKFHRLDLFLVPKNSLFIISIKVSNVINELILDNFFLLFFFLNNFKFKFGR